MLKKVLSFVLLSVLFFPSFGQDFRTRWVDSVFSTLDRNQKIGQLFMVPVSSHASQDELDELTDLVKGNDIGGYYITDGGPISHIRLFNKLQKNSKIPLLVGISAEWGLAQTMDSTMGFQKPMMSAAWNSDSLTRIWAKEIAQQMKLLGFHINFAPNSDKEIFPGDYLRYFSNDQNKLIRSAVTFSKSLQSEGILTVTKHLPRRKMVENQLMDSTVVLNLWKIDTTEFYIIRHLIESGVNGILTNYLHFSLQNEKGIVPAGMSQVFISEILKKRLNFKGLVFTETKNFEKVGAKVRAGEAELLAFQTGNDILMAPLNINSAIKVISKKIKKDKFLQQQLETTVKKILAAKYDAGLNHRQLLNEENIFQKLHTPESNLLKHQLAEATTTVVKNEENLLPILHLENKSFQCISIGKENTNDFTLYLKRYAAFEAFSIQDASDTLKINIKPDHIIIVGLFSYATTLEYQLSSWIRNLSLRNKVIIVHFGNPLNLETYLSANSLIAAYTDQDKMMEVVPQMIFGAIPASGVLPVESKGFSPRPIRTGKIDRMSYTLPEAAGMDSRTLDKIKILMKEAIDMANTPGCQVIVIRNGKVVFQQSAGWLTYENKIAVDEETIYDLASLTKVSATLQATMFMYEKNLIDVNKKASIYLPVLKKTNKKDITIIDMLTHQSGLIPFMPLWPLTVKDSVYMPYYYSSIRDSQHPLQISRDLYAVPAIKDSVWSWVINSKMQDKIPRTQYPYRYSDLGFMMMKEMAEKTLNQPMDEFLHQNLYEPLGASTTGFNPLDRFSEQRIAPTEIDKIYRRSLVAGTVHDERAAMMGGVSGHAGLFSTANDLSKIGQMLLQEGSYGGMTFYKPETMHYFTAKQFTESRRGLGWDKPVQNDWTSPVSLQASPLTFGHTGFTGTCMWIDPEFNLVYIFLSNRVFPDRNTKLLNANIRPRIQEVIYQSIFNYCAYKN
ncbi:MAG: serine hydrolase [Cyclobacteriaceae bacterium]|nr:serine hydrolase [Cyclobacteriaceae bacterium]